MYTKLVGLGLLLGPLALHGQDTRVLTDAIGQLKGTANEAIKANPVLAIGSGEGVGTMIKGLTGRRSSGKGAVQVALPKAQQDELDKREKARELAAARAKAGPKRVAAPVPVAAASTLPAITPLVMLAILHPRPQPLFTLVSEQDLLKVTEGQSRNAVVTALGKPSSVAAMTGLEDGTREVLTYHLDRNRTVAVRLQSGVVTSITRNQGAL